MLKRAKARNIPQRTLTSEEKSLAHRLVKEGKLVKFKWPHMIYYRLPNED